MIENGADFLKWLKVFKVKTGGNDTGTISPTFGEVFVDENARATQMPDNFWHKIEAGDFLAPPTPPLYTDYMQGTVLDWIWDALNARLVYVGLTPGYFKVGLSTSFAVPGYGTLTDIITSVAKSGDYNVGSPGNLITKALQVVTFTAFNQYQLVCCQGYDYFLPGDYIEAVVQCNTVPSNAIIARFLNMNAFVVQNLPQATNLTPIVDQVNNNIVDQNSNILEGAV